jgi:hypothetical protein
MAPGLEGLAGFLRLLLQRHVQQGLEKFTDIQGFVRVSLYRVCADTLFY